MAKPIRATPALVGEDALHFVERMRAVDRANRLSKADKVFIEIMNRNKRLFEA